MTGCDCSEQPHDSPYRHPGHATVQRTTVAQRKAWKDKYPKMHVGRYIVVQAEDPELMLLTFAMPNTGNTRAEAVFWAERWASKSGYGYIAPKGWENVEGKLP